MASAIEAFPECKNSIVPCVRDGRFQIIDKRYFIQSGNRCFKAKTECEACLPNLVDGPGPNA